MEDLIMKKIIMFVMVLAIGLTAGIANAAQVAEESFEYTVGASLASKNGGTGWAGPWSVASGAEIGAGSMDPPGAVGKGNHVEVVDNSGDTEEWYERDLTTPLLDDGSTYWVSVMFQKSNNDNTGSWSGFAVGENIWFGKGYNEDNLVLWSNLGGYIDTGVPATNLSWLVLKIESNPVAEEQVYMWINPDVDNEPSTLSANANLEIPLGLGGADFFVLEYGSSAANSGDFKCDEIKIGTLFDDVVDPVGPKNPILIDPNVMDVYETGETEGDFKVSLKFPPEGQGAPGNPDGTPISVNIIVDPNGFDGGGNSDITLIGGSGPHNRIEFTRDAGNWSDETVICFKAVEDLEPEPETEGLADLQNIVVWAEPISTTEPNWSRPVAQKTPGGVVWDNDKANILFTYSLPEKHAVYADVTGPVQLWEEPRVRFGTPYTRWRKIGVTLQVQPLGGPVKLQAEVTGDIIGDNLPHTDPCLPFLDIHDPNGLIFTAANYSTPQKIKIWGFDDAVLQNEDAEAEGDQNYQAQVVFTVVDGGGDTRYQWLEPDPEDPCAPDILVGLERTVDIDIEDNECGTFGTRPMDVGNPNAFTDPNYRDSDGNPLPDCIVNIWDAIEMAIRFLDCSDISDPSCESYL
jgi:hypothetical protein